MTQLDVGDAEEYTRGLSQIGEGWWRQIALGFKLGVPEALGMDRQEWVKDRIGGYMKLEVPDRREAVKELASDGMNNYEIADTLGIDEKTVRRDRGDEAAKAAPMSDEEQVTDRSNGDEAAKAAPIPDSADADDLSSATPESDTAPEPESERTEPQPTEPQPESVAPGKTKEDKAKLQREAAERERAEQERRERSQWHGWLHQTIERLAAMTPEEIATRSAEYDPETYLLPRLTEAEFDAAIDRLITLRKELL